MSTRENGGRSAGCKGLLFRGIGTETGRFSSEGQMGALNIPGTPTRDRFGSLLFACFALLVTSLFAAAALTGPFAWAVGIIYICYDTWLLSHMVRASRRAIHEQPAGPVTARPTIAVLIAARNEEAALPATLDAVRAQTDRAEQVIAIDDGS